MTKLTKLRQVKIKKCTVISSVSQIFVLNARFKIYTLHFFCHFSASIMYKIDFDNKIAFLGKEWNPLP